VRRFRLIALPAAVLFLAPCHDGTDVRTSASSVAPELATTARLHGEYTFTTTRHCVHLPTGAPPPESIDAAFAFGQRSVAKLTGVVSYDGQGGGKITGGTTMSFNLAVASPGQPVSVNAFDCTFSYEVSGAIVSEADYSCDFDIIAGAGVGDSGNSSQIETRRRIVQGNTALISVENDASVWEKVEQWTGDPPTNLRTTYRLCTRSTTAYKI
jgi:hypothetical protein